MDTSIIGPVTVMKDYVARFGEQSAIIHGAVVSSILIPAALSSFFAGYVADLLRGLATEHQVDELLAIQLRRRAASDDPAVTDRDMCRERP